VAAENSSTDSAQMADCEACGRTHLSKNWRDGLDEQTINFLEISLEENPGKYVLTGCEEPIFYTNFGGKEIVLECPCNFLKSVENRFGHCNQK
jgi:hypothetical protein